MTTIDQLKSQIDLNQINADLKSNKYLGALNFNQLFECDLEGLVKRLFENNCVADSALSVYGETSFYYNIKSENVIISLRELYVATKSKFVKDVVASVGKAKRFSEKQLEVIAKEVIKLNLTLKF
jgi:hypothetical protein